jgi:hypothetical protein
MGSPEAFTLETLPRLPQYRVKVSEVVVMGPENKQEPMSPPPETTGVEGCRTESAALWKSRNFEAITAYNAQVDEEGVFSDGMRTF